MKKRKFKYFWKDEKGAVLAIALVMLGLFSLLGIGAVITSSVDTKISGNYRTGTQAFYSAEAGVEEARARLRANATNPINDNYPTQAGWRAYIGDTTKAQGKGYSSGNSMHVRTDSIQSNLDYVVEIRHKTNASSNILYWGDPDNDGINTQNSTTSQNIYIATSYGSAGSSNKTVEMELTRIPPINAPAALYTEAPTTIQGASTWVIGTDAGCGGNAMPGIVITLPPGSVTQNGTPNSNITGAGGTTPNITYSGTNMNVQTIVNQFKGSPGYSYNVTSATHTGMSWGTPTAGATQQDPSSCSASNVVYYNTNGTDIKLSGGTSGCGILLVEGDLEVNGGFSWHGLVIATGSVTLLGGGNKNITGAVLAGGSVDADVIGGNANIVYCSDAIDDQTKNRPLIVLGWRGL